MEYSVIIPYHSNKIFLELCINSLKETVPDKVEIILVVNTTNTTEHLVDFGKRVQTIVIKENLGYSKAVNLGAKAAKGKYLIICDADTTYVQGWFESLTSFYKSKSNIGIASSKLLNPDTGKIIDFGMALSKYNNAHPFMDRDPDFKLVRDDRRVQMACSANMIIEKALFEKMGMHDEDLFNFYQDTDLCLRLKDFNKECWVVADSIAFHKGGSAEVNRTPYRADIKGYYVAKNFDRMEIDLHHFYNESFELLSSSYSFYPKYLLVDISTVADKEWYHNIIKTKLNISDIYDFAPKERDLNSVRLLDILGYNLLKTRFPLVYFVDRFVSLSPNSLWNSLRPGLSDLVIDRNANVLPMQELNTIIQ